MTETDVRSLQRAAMFGARPLPDGIPAAPACTVCGSPVLSDGLTVCSRHVKHELGITYRQLNYWVMQGYLRPKQDARLSGVPRRWPAAEIEIAKRMARLTDAGVIPERAAVFARQSWPKGEIAPGIVIEVTGEPGIPVAEEIALAIEDSVCAPAEQCRDNRCPDCYRYAQAQRDAATARRIGGRLVRSYARGKNHPKIFRAQQSETGGFHD
jgi:hypothetical protein